LAVQIVRLAGRELSTLCCSSGISWPGIGVSMVGSLPWLTSSA
jgi:hypothetical protein